MTISLTIKVFTQQAFDLPTQDAYKMVNFAAADYLYPVIEQQLYKIGSPANPSASPYPIFPDDATAIAALESSMSALLINDVNTAVGFTAYAGHTLETVDTSVAAALLGLATVARTGDYNDLINKPTANPITITGVTPTLNSASILSTTRNAQVTYPVDVAVGAALLSSSSGSVYLDYADNSIMTTNLVSIGPFNNSNSGVLAAQNTGTVTVEGTVPANKYHRVRTVTNSGTVTFTPRAGQVVLE